MKQILIDSVNVAKGWIFVASHSLIKVPGTTEPVNILRVNPVIRAALVAQLVSQIDDSERYTFKQDETGRASVMNSDPKEGQPDLSSFHGDSRSDNALKAIDASGFLSHG